MMYNKLHFANALLPTGRKLSFHKKTYSELHPKKDDNGIRQIEKDDSSVE